MQLKIKVLWLKNVLGCAINQEGVKGSYQLTPFYFWPKTEAWEQIKLELDSKNWLSNDEKVKTLNLITAVMNHWKSFRNSEEFSTLKKNLPEVDFVKIGD